ncbi:MAG: resA [Firmicutes bacterium]|nr:resA [Bacillota bacterium]
MRKSTVGIFLSLVILLCSISVCSAASTGVGSPMPEFTLNALNGEPVTVAPSDKVTIINFWATWCPPCRQEMPELNNFFLKHGDQVVFYSVNLGETADKVNNFMYRNNYSIPTLLDSSNAVSDLYGVQYIPTTIVVDRNGVIRFRTSGGMTMAELEEIVNRL